MKLEMRAKETERELLMAPSAEEVMNEGSRREVAAPMKRRRSMQTQEEKDDYFNKIANDP